MFWRFPGVIWLPCSSPFGKQLESKAARYTERLFYARSCCGIKFPFWELVYFFVAGDNDPKLGTFLFMRLVGKEKLQHFLCSDEATASWIRAWVAEVGNAHWKAPSDVVQQFPNVRQPDPGRFAFPIGEGIRKVSLQIAFQQGIAVITAIE